MTIVTSYWNLDGFNLSMELQNGTILDTQTSSSTSGGTINSNLNTQNYSVIILRYTYTINSTTTEGLVYYSVLSSNWDDWSIKTFFSDFELYVDSGIYGLDDFGVSLLIFLILFLSVGIVSYKFGFTSPIAVTSMIFGIVYFFDIAVDVLPDIRGIPNVLTFIAATLLATAVISEVRQ